MESSEEITLKKRKSEDAAIVLIERAMSAGLSVLRDLDTARGQIRLMQRSATVFDTDCPANARSFDTAVTAAFIGCSMIVSDFKPPADYQPQPEDELASSDQSGVSK